jgi:membrane protease YdiL (CAAX protease family)
MSNSNRLKTIRLIVIFSVLVNLLAWIAPLLGDAPSSPGPGSVLWGTAPLLVSLLMRTITRDWSDLGLKPGIRKNACWYFFSLLAIPVLMVLTLLVGVLLLLSSVADFLLGEFLQTVLMALPVFLIFAIFEEVGWRGYLAPKLDSLGLNSFIAYAIVGFVWASWHLPYIRELTWVYTSEDLSVFIPRYYLVCFALSILYGETRSITATFWPAVFMHGITNAFGHPLVAEYVTFAPGAEHLGSVSTGFIFIVFVGLLGVAINRWRMKQIKLSNSPA